ncbi:hypothetical protein HMPREF0299_5087 [Corynebacterium matruchotii ATCC 14266]|uniref:Uncharacterized protein n=1 Tax=Corynebacterium matruchotii ATCC 14266 TaxID=553207 RepID=E0DHD5_9CORY|nr:hypothetical protein HMPREF0299_5087 [Corynebacterium matruchotii ATCC 14266]
MRKLGKTAGYVRDWGCGLWCVVDRGGRGGGACEVDPARRNRPGCVAVSWVDPACRNGGAGLAIAVRP